jgi:hypothetical protein
VRANGGGGTEVDPHEGHADNAPYGALAKRGRARS